MKKALLTVQGINENPSYLHSHVVKKFDIVNKYDLIENAETELVFDKAWYTRIPVLGGHWFSQRIGDVIQFFTQKESRKAACRKVRNKILSLQERGYVVDIVAHSLGCQIVLCCGPSNKMPIAARNLFLMAPPLGFGINLAKPLNFRDKIVEHTKKFGHRISFENVCAFWSQKDLVCRALGKDLAARNEIISVTNKSISFTETKTGHSDEEYLNFVVDKLTTLV
jgi:hypothetical protein